MKRERVVIRLRSSLWVVPLLCVLAGVGLSFATIAVDRAHPGLVPRTLIGSPAAAQTILSTIASSMVTLITLVLTVTMVAIQLAMGQFSPRIVRALLNDRRSQLAHGLFIATFAYAILGIREIGATGVGVPRLTVLVAEILAFASVVTLVLHVHRAGQALRVSGLIDLVGDELRHQVDRHFPRRRPQPIREGDVIHAPEPGAIVRVDEDDLVAAARDADCVLELLPRMGDFVPRDAPLLRVHGAGTTLDADDVARCVVVAAERTHKDDPAYGVRKLVDIAERAIAQPFADPTTTVQAIDRLHDCLRQLATRPFPPTRLTDEDGRVRMLMPRLGWEGFVRLSFDELRLAGAGTPQVARRLRAALLDLKSVAPPERQAPLDRQLALLTAGVERAFEDEEDLRAARVADQQGIGSGADVTVRDGADGNRLGPRVQPRAARR